MPFSPEYHRLPRALGASKIFDPMSRSIEYQELRSCILALIKQEDNSLLNLRYLTFISGDYILLISVLLTQRLDILHKINFNEDVIKQAITWNSSLVFELTAELGYLDSFLKCLNYLSINKHEFILSETGYAAFCAAITGGQINILNWFKSQAPQKVFETLIAAESFRAFFLAAETSQMESLGWLQRQEPEKFEVMKIEEEAFFFAVNNGSIAILERFKERYPKKIKSVIMADDFRAFQDAASEGHIDVLEWIKREAPKLLSVMIAACDFRAFNGAARNAHVHILNWIKQESSPVLIAKMVEASVNVVYLINGNLSLLNILSWFKQEAPIQWQAMISHEDYGVFRSVARDGNCNVLGWFRQEEPEIFPRMIESNNFEAYRMILESHPSVDVIDILLSYTHCFAYAESHAQGELSSRLVNSFIEKKMGLLRAQQQGLGVDETFDMTGASEAKFYFYILRSCIRRSNLPATEFLLCIPAIKRLAHQMITPNQPNELVSLAFSLKNWSAVQLLLDIPVVNRLTSNSNYLSGLTKDELQQVLVITTPKVILLNLSGQDFTTTLPRVIATIFSCISPYVKILDLYKINLHNMTIPRIQAMGHLPNIETIYISHTEAIGMSNEQCRAFTKIFSNLKHPVFLDDAKKPIQGNLVASINYAKSRGFEVPFPSLQALAGFFSNPVQLDHNNRQRLAIYFSGI